MRSRTSGLDLRRGLAHLQAAEFLYETRFFPDLEYTFKHALTHEVAYGGLLTIGGAPSTRGSSKPSSALWPDRLAEHVERLAHHAIRGEAVGPGGDLPRARPVARRRRGRYTATRSPTSNRHWRRWTTCRRAGSA